MMNTSDYIALEERYGAHNYHPLDVVINRAEGVVGLGRRRAQVPRLPRRLLGGQPGALPSPHPQGAGRAELPRRPDLPGLPQRPARALLPRDLRAHRLREVPADEHRRRSGRDRHQGGAQVGLQGQGRARRQGRDPRVPRQLPRADHDDRGLLLRGPVPRRLRAVPRRLPPAALRRRRRGRGRHEAARRGVPGRADPGRRRHHRAARGIPPPLARAAPASTTRCSSPTRSRPASAEPGSSSPTSTRRSGPTSSSSARRSPAASTPSPASSPTTR